MTARCGAVRSGRGDPCDWPSHHAVVLPPRARLRVRLLLGVAHIPPMRRAGAVAGGTGRAGGHHAHGQGGGHGSIYSGSKVARA